MSIQNVCEFLARRALFFIVLAQLCGTSLWFSVNGVWLSLAEDLNLSEADLGYLTLSVQIGFIAGTLALAVTGLPDRCRASVIFALASLAGALVNSGFILAAANFPAALMLRFLTGLCLAGIYPLGMKLVIAWVPRHAGAALSWLVGMLTLGTALPHLMRGVAWDLSWYWPLAGASFLALVGGAVILTLGDGPYLPQTVGKVVLRQGLAAFRLPNFRAVTGGYFGHCWELYAFWMLTPLLVEREIMRLQITADAIPWFSFGVIALGLAGCVGGGWLSRTYGSSWVAKRALLISGSLCLIYPLIAWTPPQLLLLLLAIWGFTVIADSPQFSALAAANAPQHLIGSSLAVMNAIGFALTIPAIWLTSHLWEYQDTWVIWWLLPGPVLGLWAMRELRG